MRAGLIDLAELGQSAFLADVGPSDRSIWRLVAAIAAGIIGAGLLTLVVLVIAGMGYMFYQAGHGVAPAQLQADLQKMMQPGAKATFESTLGVLAFLAVANGLFFGGIVVIAAMINRRRLRSYITAARRFRWRMLVMGMVLFTVVIGPVLALDVVLSGKPPEWPLLTLAHTVAERGFYVVVALVTLTIAAGVEEMLCRGWLLKQTAAWSRNFWVLAIVDGLIFSTMHLPDTDPNAFVGRALMGMGFVYMTLRTSGVEFSTGAHAANNILLLLFVQPPPLAVPAPEKFQILSVLPTILAVLGYVVISEIVVRWPALHAWAQSTVELDAPEAEVF